MDCCARRCLASSSLLSSPLPLWQLSKATDRDKRVTSETTGSVYICSLVITRTMSDLNKCTECYNVILPFPRFRSTYKNYLCYTWHKKKTIHNRKEITCFSVTLWMIPPCQLLFSYVWIPCTSSSSCSVKSSCPQKVIKLVEDKLLEVGKRKKKSSRALLCENRIKIINIKNSPDFTS